MKTRTAFMLALTVAAAGCDSKTDASYEANSTLSASEAAPSEGGGVGGGEGYGAGAAPTGGEAKASAGIGARRGAPAAPAADAPARARDRARAKKKLAAPMEKPSAEVAVADSALDEEVMRAPRPMAGQLTAGEWNDVDNWAFWTSLMGDGYSSHLKTWRFAMDHRVTVKVTGGSGALRNVPVKLIDNQGNAIWTTKTDGQGDAVLFAGQQAIAPFKLKVGNEAERSVKPGEAVEMRLNDGPQVADAIDVMFVVDTTGSMADELAYIQSEIISVANRVKKRTNNEFALRVAASVYRDHSDEYLVRSSKFSTDVSKAKAFLDKESAGGGGDFPEAVDEALDEAIHEHQWSPNARARVLFLVLDAPPHQDAEGLARLQKSIKTAAAQGVQLIPVVGSGIDKPTEFLMRGMAIATNGTYVFLTDDSGIGGSHLKPTTGDYEVEKLNDLLVRLIVERAS